jgi:hypothetical protein
MAIPAARRRACAWGRWRSWQPTPGAPARPIRTRLDAHVAPGGNRYWPILYQEPYQSTTVDSLVAAPPFFAFLYSNVFCNPALQNVVAWTSGVESNKKTAERQIGDVAQLLPRQLGWPSKSMSEIPVCP